MKDKDVIKKSKAQKFNNYGRPKFCSKCNKMMIPKLHCRIIKEDFFNTEMSRLYKDNCEWCGNAFEYWE